MELKDFVLGVAASLVASYIWQMYQTNKNDIPNPVELIIRDEDDEDTADFINVKSRR